MPRRFHFRPEYEIPELWWEIASYCTPRTLRSLSLVSKKLVDPAQRHLFKELSLKIGLPSHYCQEDYADSAWKRLEDLAESHLRHYVRHWTCEGFNNSANYRPPAAFIDAAAMLIVLLRHTLPQFTMLNSLHIRYMAVYDNIMAAIATLKNLKSLHLVGVTFDLEHVLPPPLPVREFLIHTGPKYFVDEDAHARLEGLLSPDHLRKLSMDCPHNDALQETLCRELITHKPHNDLDHLAFSISGLGAVPTLAELLQASPLLQVLKVTVVWPPQNDLDPLDLDEALTSIPLSSDACRLVDDLTSAPPFASAFCPGRPIRKFSMQCGRLFSRSYSLEDVMDCLRCLDGRILTELKFDSTTTDDARVILPALADLFPNLKVLCMPINEAEGQVPSYRLAQTLDDMEIEDPDDIKRERKQFEDCYDDGYDDIDMLRLPDTQVSFCDGYLVTPSFRHRVRDDDTAP
ncbi:hypothetical protein CPC08DRAFT_171659 [Agrocybe pediades]|nr:hypothetical protein CPC08DRAFT_171659 [Agrocybe pediades]